MTFSCYYGHTKSEIRNSAESDITLIMIPVEKMEAWLSKYKSWRAYVLESYICHGFGNT